MSLNPSYITALDLSESLLDKDTGAPLAGGTVWFYEDASRTTPKLVYELSGAPPNYTYAALPNPITLNAIGTFSDNNGANVPVYYYPYDTNSPPNIQLYYIAVYNANGVLQFTREGWPNVTASSSPLTSSGTYTNALINPQFIDIAFAATNPLTITFASATTTTTVLGSGWTLSIVSSGAGTVVVTRNAIAGISAYPGNPPYTLTIAPGLNVTGLTLTQTFANNPDIFSPAAGATDGYIAASILLAPTSSISMGYQPNGFALQPILAANNTTGSYNEFNATVQLATCANTNNGDTGSVAIVLTLPITVATTFSNLQIVGLESNIPNIAYVQVPANIQRALVGGSSSYTAAANGTAGQVYTANGPGLPPTFQALPTGLFVQKVETVVSTPSSGYTSVVPIDTTPQITDGTQVIAVTITPTNIANNLLIEFNCPVVGNSGSGLGIFALYQNGTAGALIAFSPTSNNNGVEALNLSYKVTAGVLTPLTFQLRAGWNSGSGLTLYFLQGWTGSPQYTFGGINRMTLSVTETT